MHFGVLCPPLPGHINPMAALARELIARGHRITFLGFPDMQGKLPADVDFMAFGVSEQPAGSLKPYLDRLGRMGGFFTIRRLMTDLAGFTDTICRRLPDALDQLRPDAVIVDQTDAAASLVATALGIPFVTVANALPLNPEPKVPPPMLPWAYDPSPKGERRNLNGYSIARMIERPITKAIRRHAARLGCPDIRFADETWSQRLQITQCVRGLDFPREQLPASFHYVGPIRGRDAALDVELPSDGRPLVFCSLGTLQGSRAHLFRAVARAAADLDVTLLVAHGGLLDERAIARLSGRPIVRPYVAQRAVLARAALAITHAGFNTVMDSLSFGVPMVALPITFEQPATGARLKRVGAAEVLGRDRSSKAIRQAMERVLGDSSYAASARQLAVEIASAGGLGRAATLIEETLCPPGRAPAGGATTADAVRDDARGDSRNGSS